MPTLTLIVAKDRCRGEPSDAWSGGTWGSSSVAHSAERRQTIASAPRVLEYTKQATFLTLCSRILELSNRRLLSDALSSL